MNQLIKYITSLFVAAFVVGGMVGATIPETASANCGGGFFLTAWHEGLTDGSCNLVSPTEISGGLQAYILTIGLNVATIILQIVGYAAIFYIIFGGFKFMTSAGSPELRASAMKTLLNAIIGLVIAIASVAIVNLMANVFTGGTRNSVGIYTGLSGDSILANALNTVYWVAGSLAVVMAVISGFNFTTSAGDPQKAAKARIGLLYSIVGLLVVALAAAITGFIQTSFN